MSESAELAPVILVTSAGPGPGRVLTLAALVAGFLQESLRVRVVAPVRSGLALEELLRVSDLVDVVTLDLIQLATPVPPVPAAHADGVPLPPVVTHASRVAMLARDPAVDILLLDDTEGLRVPLDEDGSSILDLIGLLDGLDVRVGAIIACPPLREVTASATYAAAGLGDHGVDTLGLVGAAWPDTETPLSAALAEHLPQATGLPWLGTVPASAAAWTREAFSDQAGRWLPLR